MPREASLAIYTRDRKIKEVVTGWLVVNKDNNRYQYYRTKQLAISAARVLKAACGGHWQVKATCDPGPYNKPGAEQELVG